MTTTAWVLFVMFHTGNATGVDVRQQRGIFDSKDVCLQKGKEFAHLTRGLPGNFHWDCIKTK